MVCVAKAKQAKLVEGKICCASAVPLNATQPVPGWQGPNQPPDYRSDGAGSCICARLLRETAKTCKSGEAEFKLTLVLAQYCIVLYKKWETVLSCSLGVSFIFRAAPFQRCLWEVSMGKSMVSRCL